MKALFSTDPTYLGDVASVSGSAISVRMAPSVASGLSVIEGRTYRIGQVGSFVRIPQGYQDLFGVIAEVGAAAAPKPVEGHDLQSGKWIRVQLVGEAIGNTFERGIGQYPNIGDNVHIATEGSLQRLYGPTKAGDISIGTLSSADSISARVSLDALVTRHSALLGSTGSGKSTTVASLLRSIAGRTGDSQTFPSARVLMLDVHGEYSAALADVANVFSVDPHPTERQLQIPYWALNANDLIEFLTGGVDGPKETAFLDKIYELKCFAHDATPFPGVERSSITVDSPIPFSLKRLWFELLDFESITFRDVGGTTPTSRTKGDAESLEPPTYEPHGMGNQPPFINRNALGLKRQLNALRSRLLDRRYDFLLHPGPWEPKHDGSLTDDLDVLLQGWLGGPEPITILDLSGVPTAVLEQMVGSILNIVYDAMFWGREKSEGGIGSRDQTADEIGRPLLIVMEEAHRYLSAKSTGVASLTAQKIAKEGRKYGVGAMIVSQRPSEVDETILSQCGTFFALRLTNPTDRQRVQGTLPDGLLSLLEVLPVLRTGEAIVMGEAVKLPMRCRITLPDREHRPKSNDPEVAKSWTRPRRPEGYGRVVASWRSQKPRAVITVEGKTPMDRKSVPSSNISSMGYDPATETLEVEFKSGSVYQYYGVPEALYEQLDRAPSIGSFLNTYIRNSYPYSLVG
jgi:uncharacterized protein